MIRVCSVVLDAAIKEDADRPTVIEAD